jgi:hypothetical protein
MCKYTHHLQKNEYHLSLFLLPAFLIIPLLSYHILFDNYFPYPSFDNYFPLEIFPSSLSITASPPQKGIQS